MSDDRIIFDRPADTPQEVVEPGLGIGSEHKPHRPLYEYFSVKEGARDQALADKALEKIWKYAETKAPSKDRDTVLFEVMRLKQRLGSPALGEKPWFKAEVFVDTYFRMRQAERQLEELTK